MDFDWRQRGERRKRFDVEDDVRFLTFSCDGRKNLLGPDWAKDIFVDHLALTKDRLGFHLWAWVVMPNHVHLLLTPNLEVANVSHILRAIKLRSSIKILTRLRQGPLPHPDRLWLGGGGYDRNVHSIEEFEEKANYIHLNPVRAELVDNPEEYRWCSAGSSLLPGDSW